MEKLLILVSIASVFKCDGHVPTAPIQSPVAFVQSFLEGHSFHFGLGLGGVLGPDGPAGTRQLLPHAAAAARGEPDVTVVLVEYQDNKLNRAPPNAYHSRHSQLPHGQPSPLLQGLQPHRHPPPPQHSQPSYGQPQLPHHGQQIHGLSQLPQYGQQPHVLPQPAYHVQQLHAHPQPPHHGQLIHAHPQPPNHGQQHHGYLPPPRPVPPHGSHEYANTKRGQHGYEQANHLIQTQGNHNQLTPNFLNNSANNKAYDYNNQMYFYNGSAYYYYYQNSTGSPTNHIPESHKAPEYESHNQFNQNHHGQKQQQASDFNQGLSSNQEFLNSLGLISGTQKSQNTFDNYPFNVPLPLSSKPSAPMTTTTVKQEETTEEPLEDFPKFVALETGIQKPAEEEEDFKIDIRFKVK